MTTAQEAVHVAAEAFGVLKEFNIRIMASTRVEIYNEVYEAVDMADAVRIARKECPSHQEFEEVYDEVAYITQVEDNLLVNDEHDFDIREGEPGKREALSWEATAFVDRVANLNVDKMPDPVAVLRRLIEQCKEMK